jgi:hypothetical protein
MTKVHFNGDYDMLPKKCVSRKGFSENGLRAIVAECHKKPKSKTLLVIDDGFGVGSSPRNTYLNEILDQYRHHRLSLWFTARRAVQIPVTARETSTFAILFRQTTKRAFNEMYDAFGQEIDKEELRRKNDSLKKHQFILYEREVGYSICGPVAMPPKYTLKPTKAP